MDLQVTDGMSKALREAAADAQLQKDVREAAASHASSSTVPWQVMKTVVAALNQHRSPDDPLLLHVLCSGTTIVLPSPGPKPPNPALEARRKVLQARLEEQQYAAMVSDITKEERDAEELRGMLPTTQSQLTFGAHVLVMMFTFWSFCYWGSKWYLGWDELWAGLLGAVGLTVGLLLETTLLIIRTNMPVSPEEKYPHLVDPRIWGSKGSKPGTAPAAAAAAAARSHKSQARPVAASSANEQLPESKKLK